MPATLQVQASLELLLSYLEAIDVGSKKYEPLIKKTLNLGSGTGLNQADRLYTDTLSIGPSATVTLDVATGGGLSDAHGNALALVKLKGLFVFAPTGNLNVLNVARPAANGVPFLAAAGDAIPVRAGSWLALAWPDATAIGVTAATADLIDFVNTAGTNTIAADVILFGTSA